MFKLAQLARWTRPAVDVTDPIQAAMACSQCLADHCPTLLTRQPWDRRTPIGSDDPTALIPYSTDASEEKGEGSEG